MSPGSDRVWADRFLRRDSSAVCSGWPKMVFGPHEKERGFGLECHGGSRQRSLLEDIDGVGHGGRTNEPTVEHLCVAASLDALQNLSGDVQATRAEEHKDGVGFALDLALYETLGVSFSVELFFDGHGHGLGSGRLPVKDGTELRELQVPGGLRDVAQEYDEKVLASGGLGEGFEVSRPSREAPQQCVSVSGVAQQPQGEARGVCKGS